jgi:hypothetical protein
MTDSTEPTPPEAEVMPPESEALSMPPPVPLKKPGLLRRIFTSRKKQQAVAMQNGYLEMVDLVRSIRTHLDRQEDVQTRVLTMLEKVPDTMDRQHEVMTLFKQQLEGNLENDRKLTESMGQLNGTLSSMDDTQKASARTVTDLIHRSRESEQLLREVMRRSERRVTFLLIFFFLALIGAGFYFLHWQNRPARPAAEAAVTAAMVSAERPTAEFADAAVAEEKAKENAATAAAKAEEQKKADELKQQQKDSAAKEKAAAAAKKKKDDTLKANKKAEEAKTKQALKADKAAKKKQVADLKAQKKAEKSRIKAEKKAKAAAEKKARKAKQKAEREAKKKAEAAERKAREAKEKADTEAATAAKKSSVAQTPEFTIERINPAAAEAPDDKPVSLP